MHTVFITADVLADEPPGMAWLSKLTAVGVEPLLLTFPTNDESDRSDTSTLRHVAVPAERLGGAPEAMRLLADAAGLADGALTDAFLICRDGRDAAFGVEHGGRVVIVLGDRLLDEVLGPDEPTWKAVGAAPDLASAARYVAEEIAEAMRIGPFPFGQPAHEERAAVVFPTRGDLARVFVLVVVAGIAVSLGITYLLREIYQTYTFPAIAYWLTFQFIPQTWRGILFLAIGTAIGLLAPRLIRRVMRRPAYR